MQRTVLGLWTWFAFAAVSAVGFCLCLLVFLVTRPFDPTRRITGTGIRWVGRAMCAAVPAWRFGYQKPVPARLPPRTVCISNHASNIDPLLLSHLPWEMKFLAKSVLFRIPFFGWGIGLAGDIPLVRGQSRSIKAAMERARFYVERGMPVLIFPEGTRSATGDLLPFKDGAFRLALQCKAAILPMAVHGTTTALRRGDWRPGPACGTILVGEPISTEGMGPEDLGALKQMARDAIAALQKELARRESAEVKA
jgi:1-acyl-sn-glycerol-3-phosphate acyltransferase